MYGSASSYSLPHTHSQPEGRRRFGFFLRLPVPVARLWLASTSTCQQWPVLTPQPVGANRHL